MSTRLHKAGSDRNCWANSQNNFFNYINGDHEYFEIVTNGNNPPTVKANTRFMVYATDTSYTISSDYATGNNEYIAGNTPTTLLNEAIFEPSDRTFTYAGTTDFPSISDGTWYLFCRGCIDTDATTIGKGEYYLSKVVTPTANYLKGGMYYNTDRCLCTWTVTSSTVSGLILYKSIMPYSMGNSGQMLSSLGNGLTQWVTPSAVATYSMLVIQDYSITNDTDTEHDIAFGAGNCLDSTYSIILSGSAMVKRIDASWSAGTENGGLFSGSVAADTVYYLHVIRKDSDGTIDYGYDTSITAANRPAGYTYYRCIGAVVTNSSNNIINGTFWRQGNQFHFKPTDFIIVRSSAVLGATSRILITHTYAPVNSYVTCQWRVADAATYYTNYGETSETDSAPSSLDNAKLITYSTSSTAISTDIIKIDGSKQSFVRGSNANVTLAIKQYKWYINL